MATGMHFDRHPRELDPPIEEVLESVRKPWEQAKQKASGVIAMLKGPVGRKIEERRYGTEEERRRAYVNFYAAIDNVFTRGASTSSESSSRISITPPPAWLHVEISRPAEVGNEFQVTVQTLGYKTGAHTVADVVVTPYSATKHWTAHHMSGGEFQPYSPAEIPEDHLRHSPLSAVEAQAFAHYLESSRVEVAQSTAPINL